TRGQALRAANSENLGQLGGGSDLELGNPTAGGPSVTDILRSRHSRTRVRARLAPAVDRGWRRGVRRPVARARAGRLRDEGHRASRSSRRRRTTSIGRFGLTRRTFLRSVTGRDAGRTSKPSFSSGSYGTSRAIGVVRSQTTTDSPRRTSARYALRWAFRSDTMALFMVLSWSDLVLRSSAGSPEDDACPRTSEARDPRPREPAAGPMAGAGGRPLTTPAAPGRALMISDVRRPTLRARHGRGSTSRARRS